MIIYYTAQADITLIDHNTWELDGTKLIDIYTIDHNTPKRRCRVNVPLDESNYTTVMGWCEDNGIKYARIEEL